MSERLSLQDMMDDEDYDFDYEDSDQDQDDGQVDMENEYYTAKGRQFQPVHLLADCSEVFTGPGGGFCHSIVMFRHGGGESAFMQILRHGQ